MAFFCLPRRPQLISIGRLRKKTVEDSSSAIFSDIFLNIEDSNFFRKIGDALGSPILKHLKRLRSSRLHLPHRSPQLSPPIRSRPPTGNLTQHLHEECFA